MLTKIISKQSSGCSFGRSVAIRGTKKKHQSAGWRIRNMGLSVKGRLAVLRDASLGALCQLRAKVVCQKGQGTTEYAILVGVLVVIAILAITVFRPKLQELWDAIASGITSL